MTKMNRSEYGAACGAVRRQAVAGGWEPTVAYNGKGYWRELRAWCDAHGVAYPSGKAVAKKGLAKKTSALDRVAAEALKHLVPAPKPKAPPSPSPSAKDLAEARRLKKNAAERERKARLRAAK